jgi:hypothetical protein
MIFWYTQPRLLADFRHACRPSAKFTRFETAGGYYLYPDSFRMLLYELCQEHRLLASR